MNRRKEIMKKRTMTEETAITESRQEETARLKDLGAFVQEEEGMGTVEIILIIVVLISLVMIFKTQLRSLVNRVFQKITQDSNTIMS